MAFCNIMARQWPKTQKLELRTHLESFFSHLAAALASEKNVMSSCCLLLYSVLSIDSSAKALWCSTVLIFHGILGETCAKPSTTRSCPAWIVGHRLWVWSWTHGNPGVRHGSPVSRGHRSETDAISHRGCSAFALGLPGMPRSSWARPWARPWALVPAVPVALCDRTQQALARSWTASLRRWVACSRHCRPLVERVPV